MASFYPCLEFGDFRLRGSHWCFPMAKSFAVLAAVELHPRRSGFGMVSITITHNESGE